MQVSRIVLFAAAAIAAATIGYVTYDEHRRQNHAIEMILGGPGKEGLIRKNKDIAPIVAAQFRDYKTNSILWSAAHHTALFGSAFLGVLATLILKLESWPAGWDDRKRKDYAAACAAFGALMVTVSTAGDFQRKWQSTRMAAAQTAAVAFELLKLEDGVPLALVNELEGIFVHQNEAIVGEGGTLPKGAKPAVAAPAPP